METIGSGRVDTHAPAGAGGLIDLSQVPSELVAVKLSAPLPVPGLLPRTDLVAQLGNWQGKLCLISAPAGWGKTSLLAAWHCAEAADRAFTFLRLEPSDDDAAMFWTCAIAALRTRHPGLLPGAFETLRTPGVDPMRRIVPSLINELCEIDEPTVLVLDDYHVLTRQRLHASIGYLIDHLPPALRLVIATRSDPPLPLARLRASGEMLEVRAGQLHLSEKEAKRLLNNRFGLDIGPRSVQLLCRRTEGWPAAVHLAGLSLQNEANPREFVDRFAGDDRNVADYLTSEVLDHLSNAHREFLLRTSVLEQLSGSLCDAVADTSGSASTLEELERSNLFLMPLDNRRHWYRYHHLFGEWLRHELHRTEPDVVPLLHLRASTWYGDQGSLELAISHAVSAGAYNRAGDLMDRYVTDLSTVNWSLVWRWLSYLPDEIVSAHPMAATGRAIAALNRGDFPDALRWIPVAEAAVEGAPVELQATISTIVSFFRALGELVAGDMDAARLGFEQIADRERPAGSPVYAMAVGYAAIATFWSVGALESVPALREGIVAYERASLPDSGLTALLAAAYSEIGNWTAAEVTANTALALPPPFESSRYPFKMPAYFALGKALAALGDYEGGITRITQGLELARSWVEPIFIAYGCVALADVLNGYAEKRSLVREARQIIEGSQGRGRIGELVAAAEHRLSLRRPSQHTAGTVYVEPLTTRERDVLRLLDSELTLREIGSELYLAHNTVKGYTKSIYRKLGVASREAAIETARQLDVR